MPIAVTNTAHFNRPEFNRQVTHGDQLTIYDVGPWALQAQYPGDELLAASPALPGRGYYRFDEPAEFLSSTPWPANANDSNPSILNDPDLHAGVVTGAPVTIDGYEIPVGTYICQFYEWPDNSEFYAQTTALKVLFRGCRWRYSLGIGGAGLFNDSFADPAQRLWLHYCDIGMQSADPPPGASGMMHIKNLGSSGHRFLRGYHSLSSTFFQPNVQGCSYVENYVTDMVYSYGEAGPLGNFGNAAYHNNGLSSEGALTSVRIERNRFVIPSPDSATGSTGYAAGEIGYGTQPGQVGYGAGSNPGRGVYQTDCIALFAIQGPNQGTTPGAILVKDNLLGGTGYCLYAGNADGNAQNIHVIGNKFTTEHWTNAANFGPMADVPAWGVNGNFEANNVWADDYGSGGDGFTLLADREKPSGNGRRRGRSILSGFGGVIAAYPPVSTATATAYNANVSTVPPPTVPTAAYALGTEVGVPTGTSLTTRTSRGSHTSTGTYELVDPTGRQPNRTVNVLIWENILFSGIDKMVAFPASGTDVWLFRNCRWDTSGALWCVEFDSETNPGDYMHPKTILDHCEIDGNLTSDKSAIGGSAWVVDTDMRRSEDGWAGVFCSVSIHSNFVGGTDGLADPHADGMQHNGIGKVVHWNNYYYDGGVAGAASQALRFGAEFGPNDDCYVAWCKIEGSVNGGWAFQMRGDNSPTTGNTGFIVHDNVVVPGGSGGDGVDCVETVITSWERNYLNTYGGTLIPNPAP